MTRAAHALLLSLAIVAALLTVSTASPALAGEREDVLALRAADLEAQGRCEDVVALYKKDSALDKSSSALDKSSSALDKSSSAGDGRVELSAGRCEVRREGYPAAIDSLTVAVARATTPGIRGAALLQLGIAHYHLGELDQARSSLDAARAAGVDDPLLDLYSGLLLLQANDARKAALSLERARRADARAVEPVASYYAFLAWRSLKDEARARAAYERVREYDADGPWVAEAERLLADDRAAAAPNVFIGALAGLEYDSNVVLKGNDVSIVLSPDGNQISGTDDGRGYWAIDGGVELFRTEDWSGGLLAGYTGTAHFDLTEFDTEYPTGSAWLDRRFGEDNTARLRYDYGYAWVDYESYLSGHTVTGSFFHDWGSAGSTEVTASGYFFDFLYDNVSIGTPAPPRCTDVDRDGDGVQVGTQHRYAPGWRDLELRAGYRFDHYDSNGCEYQYDSHEFSTGFDVGLLFDIHLDSWVSFTYRPYEHVSAYLGNNENVAHHRDRMWRTGVSLERPLTDHLSVIARYDYTDAGSNTDAYDYHRHVVGAYVRVRFD